MLKITQKLSLKKKIKKQAMASQQKAGVGCHPDCQSMLLLNTESRLVRLDRIHRSAMDLCKSRRCPGHMLRGSQSLG